jgi:ABC-type uncharacterized transport system fused permease/ATPase subunit
MCDRITEKDQTPLMLLKSDEDDFKDLSNCLADSNAHRSEFKIYIDELSVLIETDQLDLAIGKFREPKNFDSKYDGEVRVSVETFNEAQLFVLQYLMPVFVQPVFSDIKQKLLLILGAGGTGKTTVVRAIELLCRDYHKMIDLTALTGNAASLLPNGVTVFKGVRYVLLC